MKKLYETKITKKIILRSASLVMTILLLTALTACNDNQNSTSETTDPSATQTTTAEPTTVPAQEDFDLSTLHTFDAVGGNRFAGVWKITDGQGSQYENFSYMFDGHNRAILFMGNTGYPENYSVDVDSENDENMIFAANLMFGINGEYSFKFNKDNTQVVLTQADSDVTTTLSKLDNFNYLPQLDENPTVDESIVGAWKSDDGEYFYFDESGLMYQNLYNKIYTYSAYSAKDGEISATYSTGASDETDTYTYSIDGNQLTLNGFSYNKISTIELE